MFTKTEFSRLTKLSHLTPPGTRLNVVDMVEDNNGTVKGTAQKYVNGVLESTYDITITQEEKRQYYIA